MGAKFEFFSLYSALTSRVVKIYLNLLQDCLHSDVVLSVEKLVSPSLIHYLNLFASHSESKTSEASFILECLVSTISYSGVVIFLNHRVLNVGDRAGHAHLLGYDFLDGCIGRLHTNFQISATLSKKVLIFVQKCHFSTFY